MIKCPHCGNDDPSMIEIENGIPVSFFGVPKKKMELFCISCSKEWIYDPFVESKEDK